MTVASKMMCEAEKNGKIKVQYSRLRIEMLNGESYSHDEEFFGPINARNTVQPWEDFVNWFNNQTEGSYTVYRNVQPIMHVYDRANIVKFSISLVTTWREPEEV